VGPGTGEDRPIRVLVVARHPLSIESLGLRDLDDVDTTQLIRRPAGLSAAIDENDPTVVMIDTGFPEGRSFAAISEANAEAPDAHVLAVTPSPPPHTDVALAVRSGAIGIVDVDAEPSELASAVRAVNRGDAWLPSSDMLTVLESVAEDLDVTTSERRSRLMSIILGFIPLAGAFAALMSLMWRGYLGPIGVRPVDLAVDPSSRVIDALEVVLGLIGVVGPLLLVGTWLNLLEQYAADRKPLARLLERRRLAGFVLSIAVLAIGVLLVIYARFLVTIFVGPLVVILILARALDLEDGIVPALRITGISPHRAFAYGVAAIVAFLAVLSYEVFIVGPDFGPKGVNGLLAPRVLGFSAQPVRVFDVDGDRVPREALYLGGNADLYVLVDPCSNDLVEYVSVGATRLEIIDEVTCESTDGG
jgi:DNA-binding NarL/FixJ family response regulator